MGQKAFFATSQVDVRIARYIVAVADYGTLRAAAKHLYVSEPALSQAIRTTEQKWGIALFERSGRKLFLTDVGRHVLPVMRQLCDTAERAHEQIASARAQRQETCRIGVVAFTVAGVSKALPDLLIKHPTLRVEVYEASSNDILQRARQDVMDVGFVLGFRHFSEDLWEPRGFRRELVKPGRLMILVSRSARFAVKSCITWEELARLPLIVFPKGFMIRDLLVETLGLAVEQHIVFTGEPGELHYLPLRLGRGVMVIPDFTLSFTPPAASFRAIPIEPIMPVELTAILPGNVPPPAPAQDLIRLLRNQLDRAAKAEYLKN